MAQAAAPLLIATTAISAAGAAASAAMQNAAIRKSMEAQKRAAKVQASQVNRQASLEEKKALIEGEQVRGRVRVAAAAAGISLEDSSFEAALNQNEINTALNAAIVEENRRMTLARVISGGRAQIADLSSRIHNVGLATLNGGLAGLTTGLQISSAGGASTPPPDDDPITNIGGLGGLPSLQGTYA